MTSNIIWSVRYGASPSQIHAMDTDDLRAEFLVEQIFQYGQARFSYTHIDRMVIGGIVPVEDPIDISKGKEVGTEFFHQVRESGIANLGKSSGRISVDGKSFTLHSRDVLYIGKGAQSVQLESVDPTRPALFYLNSVPAGRDIPTKLITKEQSKMVTFGEEKRANKRDLRMYIHPEVTPSCLLLMGITDPCDNSVWNTMPPHLHERRMEAYLYFDMDEQDRVFHIMGRPDKTRHLVVASGDVVLSPAWSIHMGAGTGKYAFVWGMTGENQVYQDVTPVALASLR